MSVFQRRCDYCTLIYCILKGINQVFITVQSHECRLNSGLWWIWKLGLLNPYVAVARNDPHAEPLAWMLACCAHAQLRLAGAGRRINLATLYSTATIPCSVAYPNTPLLAITTLCPRAAAHSYPPTSSSPHPIPKGNTNHPQETGPTWPKRTLMRKETLPRHPRLYCLWEYRINTDPL
jgi:hypothetical protein